MTCRYRLIPRLDHSSWPWQDLGAEERDAEEDELQDQAEGAWEPTGQTFAGKGSNGEDMVFTLQRRGNNFRIAPRPKGQGKGSQAKGDSNLSNNSDSGKASKWDPRGCARCGRGSHWAKECRALLDVNGEKCKEKLDKPRKPGNKGGRLPYCHCSMAVTWQE